ncbi:MAG: enoyl-CoA hydratase/isomerase family protein [Pseudomonadota bacterium]
MNYQDYSALKFTRNGRILTVTINRPEVKNAINATLHEEFSRVFSDIDRDDETDIVILTGAGKAFCAGGDLDWLLSIHGDIARTAAGIRNDRRIQNSILDLEKPIIAKLRGPAIGLGCSLALFCDFVYAAPDVVLADPHVCVGLVAGDGGAILWPQLIGYMRAKSYLLTGDRITSTDAAQMGLITKVLPESELDDAVEALAARLAAGSTHSIKWTKASINAGLKVIANAVIDRAAAYENISQLQQDHRIALEAFQKREAPKFVGR